MKIATAYGASMGPIVNRPILERISSGVTLTEPAQWNQARHIAQMATRSAAL